MRANPTIVDIAKRLGLSDSTVSRSLNHRPDPFISEATRERVLAAAAELGYRPNKLAAALVTGKTHTIGLWVSGVRTQYYTEVTYHLQDRLRQDGYELIPDPAGGMGRPKPDTFPFSPWPFDGIMACDPPGEMKMYRDNPALRQMPLVSVGVFYWAETDHVGIDLFSGARSAVRHLLKFGSRIALVAPRLEDSRVEPRYRAYRDEMARAGLDTEFIYVPSNERSDARKIIRQYVRRHGCPRGLFAYNDHIAVGVHRGLKDLGISIPAEAALIGCDGIEDTEYHDPAISTIDMCLGTVSRLAWKFLRRRINNPKLGPQRIIVKPRLVIRESAEYQKGRKS